MTNKDKYLKDGVDVEELAIKIIEYGVFGDTATWKQAIIEFMNKQVKPTLTEDEKVILRNIKVQNTCDAYIVIKREDEHTLVISGVCGTTGNLSMYAHLFQFIQPRRRI